MNFNDIRNEFEGGVEHVGAFAREVVAKRVAVIAAVTILVNLAISYGWLTPDVSDEVLKWLGALFDAIAAIAAIAVVRPAVTPTVDPRNDAGDKLVPVSDVMAVIEKTTSDLQNEYTEVRKGNVDNAPQAIQEAIDASNQLVENVKADVEAVVKPIRDALADENQAPTPPAHPTL